MTEKRLHTKVVNWLKSLPNTHAYKRLGGVANKGEPDVTGCSHGIRIELEGKLPGKHPTPLQKKKLEWWTEAGAITGVYHSLNEAQHIVGTGLYKKGIIIE
jgi:hypothetical protein